MSLNRSIRRNIRKDKSLEPYFLNLSEWIYRTEDLEDEEEYPYEYDQATNLLLEKILKEYKIDNSNDLSDTIFEVIEYYREKYSIEEQFEKNKRWRLKNSFDMNLDEEHDNQGNWGLENRIDLEEKLNKQINPCRQCSSPRTSLTFEELPHESKEAFESEKEDADYFLYCNKCKSYSMIYKSQSF